MIPPRPASAALLLGSLFMAMPAWAQDHDHSSHGEVGRVNFPTSCTPAAAPVVELGVAMLHSFWFDEAARTFERSLAADPGCGMAHWGIAVTMLGNPFTASPPSAERARTGLAAARRAVELTRGATHREQMYAAAALALYDEAGGRNYRSRMLSHEEAMGALAAAHPEDPEATIFHARALISNAPPEDLEFKRQLAAAELLEPLFARMPDHPGLAHYIIHAFDAPPIAQQGLAAARRYADIAPAAPHALHMPSHIFTRLGYWEESVEANRRSAAAEPDSNAAVHPLDYMVYAFLQLGRDSEAKKVVDRSTSHLDRFYGGLLGYNAAAMPARYALERSAWSEAAAIRPPQGGAPYVQAISHYARAVGAARSGERASAAASVAALAELRDTLTASGEKYWATVVGAQHLAASAWLARLDGDDERALRLAREGAELEETVEKHPVTPGPILPARELEGDLLLELGRPGEAKAAYEKTLAREPNRARTIYGIARSAELTGELDTAREHYRRLAETMAGGDGRRAEVERARQFLSRGGG
jgi:tetratricopeptide (TPR) repeat protein